MPKRYIVTGAPGAGKTTLLRALQERHWSVVEEAATDVIAWQQAAGRSEPWCDRGFTGEIALLQRQRQLQPVPADVDVQFYDRSPLCTLALAKFLEHRVPEELSAEIDRVTQREVYENTVFFVRPIGFIQPTAARQISYADSLTFEAIHEAVYRDHGFQLVDIAPGSVAERVATVEARIAGEQNGRIKGPTGSSH